MYVSRDVHSPKPMMHITYSPYFDKIYKCPPITAKFINLSPIFAQFKPF